MLNTDCSKEDWMEISEEGGFFEKTGLINFSSCTKLKSNMLKCKFLMKIILT